MARVYVRAVVMFSEYDEHGKLIQYHAGDWVAVSKWRAIELLDTGRAEIPDTEQVRRALKADLEDCGIYVRSGTIRDAKGISGRHKLPAVEWSGSLRLPFERTLLWDKRVPLDPGHTALGFVRVEESEVAAMLRGNEMMSMQVGDGLEHQKTLATVGDLRLPVYETGAIWVRKTKATEKMIAAWGEELKESECEEHAFLRALYTNRVLLATLPARWLGKWRHRA